MVDRGLQAGGREGEHRRLKVLGAERGGKVTGEEGGRLGGTGRGWFRRFGVSRGGAEDLRLKLQELSHEAEVGRDDVAALLDDVKGGVQPQLLRPHDVGHADGRGARDAGLAVDQHLSPRLLHVIWEEKKTSVKSCESRIDLRLLLRPSSVRDLLRSVPARQHPRRVTVTR